jgi:hypothetical protein
MDSYNTGLSTIYNTKKMRGKLQPLMALSENAEDLIK